MSGGRTITVGLYSGGSDTVFTSAGFGAAFGRLAGTSGLLGDKYVRAILLGRLDVEPLKGGAHFRLRSRT